MEQFKDIVARVVRLQQGRGYTDQQMAGFLGCSRPTYQRTRTGRIAAGSAFINGALKFLAQAEGQGRAATLKRETGETQVNIELNIDGTGQYEISTGTAIFDHLLCQLARHGKFDIKIKARGDDQHHIVEDVAITLGQAFGMALGEKRGIVRMADATVPMDEALAMVAVDISGRGYAVVDLPLAGNDMPGLAPDLIRHFLESLALEARCNLHARAICGNNDHHKAEALFKALGRALDTATRIDERAGGALPTTKDYLEG